MTDHPPTHRPVDDVAAARAAGYAEALVHVLAKLEVEAHTESLTPALKPGFFHAHQLVRAVGRDSVAQGPGGPR